MFSCCGCLCDDDTDAKTSDDLVFVKILYNTDKCKINVYKIKNKHVIFKQCKTDRELNILVKLWQKSNHIGQQHIVKLIGNRQNNIILEYIKEDLFTYLTHNMLSYVQSMVYFKQMVTSIHYIHSLNIAHLDLSLENILIENDMIYICDFGNATQDGWFTGQCGKTCYIPPEAYEGFYNGKSADVWSLGIILFIMLSGDFLYQSYEECANILQQGTSYLAKYFKTYKIDVPDDILTLLCNMICRHKDRWTIIEIAKYLKICQ